LLKQSAAAASPPAEKATNSSRLPVVLAALRQRIVQRAENISSALKRRVNVCQEPPVSELLGSLVTEFVRDFGGEDATPIQLGSHRGLLDDI
jgi:hypothetical protein